MITGAMKLFFRELKDPVIDSHSLEKIYSVLSTCFLKDFTLYAFYSLCIFSSN